MGIFFWSLAKQDVQWDRQADYCDPLCRKYTRIPVEKIFSPVLQNDC
jgi:hypothetical protein